VVNISPKETSRWVAFDISKKEWKMLVADLGLLDSPNPSLKYATSRTPDDTGFQGYLDGDYETKSDKSGGYYFFREVPNNKVRAVYFRRDN
jgi:hypothetical protein